MMPEVSRPVPQHLQVADYYKQQILDGVIRSGDRLPSVREIMRDWTVSHNIAQRALGHLKTGGLVRTGPDGTFATPGRAIYGPQQRIRATTFPGTERVEVRTAEIITAPAYVIPILGLEPSADGITRVLRREWVTYKNGSEPFMLWVLWCQPEFAGPVPELLALYPLPGSGEAAKLIAERTGQSVAEIRGRSSWEARPIRDDGREGPLLHLPRDAHVLAQVYIWWHRDTVLEYVEFVALEGQVIEADMEP